MIKQHLPKNWIVVNSKSYPDKIYYFNVKTSQSSWNQPTLEKSNKASHLNKCKFSDKQGKSSSKQKSHDKMVETSKSRALQEKMSLNTKVTRKATPSSSSLTSSSSTSSSSSLTQSNTSTSVHSTSNETQTYTPQMCALREKIQRKNLNTSNRSSNISNASLSSKSANTSSTSNPDSRSKPVIKYKTQEERNTENKGRHYWNKNGKKEENYGLRKNLAKERMQMIRKHLGLDKKKCKEIGRVIVDKPPLQKSNNTTSCNNSNFRHTYIYKNAGARLKKLRDRLMKESMCENNIMSNTVLQNQTNQQNPEIMTSEKLIEQAQHEILDEEMDWEPMKDEEITLEIEVARTQLCRENHKSTTDYISGNTIELTQSNNGAESSVKPPIYIVVDTNVFLTNLQIIEEARDAIFKNYSCSYIVIAWTVICELDYLKDSKRRPELNTKVRKAISFIHEQFSSKHPRVIGQTQEQAVKNKEKFAITCPDDDILQCCLQIQKLQKHVVLLSYDKNLCTKAMLHNVVIVERKDTLDKIDPIIKPNNETISQSSSMINNNSDSSLFSEELRLADNIFVNIKAVIKDFLSTIISKQMSMIYGEAEWQTYVIIKPPWTVVTALKCAIKHWIAAVSEAFQRRAELYLKELLQAFEHAPDGGRKLENLEYILGKCNDFVQLANTEKYDNLITETINTIMMLKEKCRNYIADINKKKLYEKIGFTDNIQEQEVRAARTFQCFECIYSYTCDFCGLACSIAGMPCMITFKSMDPPLSKTDVENIRPEITRKVIDLTQNLNKLLVQAERSVKYQTLVDLQQNLNTFLPDNERTKIPFDVELLDIYCCLRLKEDILKNGLRQLQELSDHFCALATRT